VQLHSPARHRSSQAQPLRLTGMLKEAPRPPTEIELSPPLEKLKRSGPRRAERRKRRPMAIVSGWLAGMARAGSTRYGDRHSSGPSPAEKGRTLNLSGSPEPVCPAEVCQPCDVVAAKSDTSVLFPAC
jgi:hypothetical protein